MNELINLGLFTAKAIIILILILVVLMAFFSLLSKGRLKSKGRLQINHLNKKFAEYIELIMGEALDKKQFKRFLKEKKAAVKAKSKQDIPKKSFVINFHGDIKASAVDSLREEITAILNVATPRDEVIVKIDSAGGTVHGYGLAAAQLMRVRAKQIPLIACIDKVAASGGYLMSCVANKILAAPFAIIGSIGVIVQLPNFNRLLKEKHIDFEQYTAGEFKRTITIFGENTDEGRQKLQEEIEDVHQLFKNLITEYRPQVNIEKVSTGEYWLGQQAMSLNLVDEIRTSDDYLLQQSHESEIFELSFEVKKSLISRFSGIKNYLQWMGNSPF